MRIFLQDFGTCRCNNLSMRWHLFLIPCLLHRCRMCRLMLPLLQWKTCRPSNLYRRRFQSAVCTSLHDRNRTCRHPGQCSLRCTYSLSTSRSLQVSMSSTDMMCTQRHRLGSTFPPRTCCCNYSVRQSLVCNQHYKEYMRFLGYRHSL
jgi:hypothetical protein